MEENRSFTTWIEAEKWPSVQWLKKDGNTDVIVTFANGERWSATFVSYENVRTLTEKNKITGENLSGAYFWASDMILVDEISRKRIEEVIQELLHVDSFESLFHFFGNEEESNELS